MIAKYCKSLLHSSWFEYFIVGVIIINSILIGVETYSLHPSIVFIQKIALGIFTIEILIRWLGKDSAKAYFSDGWNIFDIVLVGLAFVPHEMFPNASLAIGLRVLRVFRVLRLIKTIPELRLMVSVLTKSSKSLFYNAIFFVIFTYLYALIGVTLFRLPDPTEADPDMQQKIETLFEVAPHSPACSLDPFGDIAEATFTLFRILTGEDWTDLRYNLVKAGELEVIPASSFIITTYHVSWMILSAFLLLNILVASILDNYQVIMEEQKQRDEVEANEQLTK